MLAARRLTTLAPSTIARRAASTFSACSSSCALSRRALTTTVARPSSLQPSAPLLSSGVRAAITRPANSSGFARRLLCTAPPKPAPPPGIDGWPRLSMVQAALHWARQNSSVVLVLGGASLVMYGFYRFSFHIMHFFLNVHPKDIFTMGFAGGMVAAVLILGAGVYANGRMMTTADGVYHAAIAELRKNDAVKKALGGPKGGGWRPSGFRGYKIESLKDAIQGSDRRQRSTFLEAPSRRVQMIFLVKGMERNGMVSLQAFKREGEYRFELLTLDLKATPGMKHEHLLLLGTTDVVLFPELSEILDASHDAAKLCGTEAVEVGDADAHEEAMSGMKEKIGL